MDAWVIRSSARRHGVSEEDIRWAVTHPLVIADVASRFGPEVEAILYLGPSRTGDLLEVVAIENDVTTIIHAMPMRKRYRYLLQERRP